MSESQNARPSRRLELAVALHVCLFMIGVSWAFGGNADWVRTPISIWGSLGILLSVAALSQPVPANISRKSTAWWALPVVVLNALVLFSCLTPGFKVLGGSTDSYLIALRVPWWIPSAARPEFTLRDLWLFDGIYFSCLNVALAIDQRRVLRVILAVIVGNAFALAVFGTIQKLVGATGIYFGAVKSPQDYFFASFVYDNHWGAFIILMMGACTGLVIRYIHGSRGDGFFRGPSFVGMVAAGLIAISVPLSGARACTMLLGLLLMLALLYGAPRLLDSLGHSGIRRRTAWLGIAVVGVFAAWGAWSVAGDVIKGRISKTKDQVAAAVAQRGIGGRSVLYQDTWRMARERPLFGWGMASYPTVFALYNTQVPTGDHIPVVFHDAHSDWLQSLAEIGFAGTALIGASVAFPALSLRKRRLGPTPKLLLAGCLLVAAYAWVEFPFGNVAVVLAWWLCFFSAVQYVGISALSEMPAKNP